MEKQDKREMTKKTFLGNVLLKGLVLGTITGISHLLVLTYLRHKFKVSN